MRTRVFKFGGSSFTDIDDYRRVAAYLRQRLADECDKLVVVVSAMAGLTERLRGLAAALAAAPSPEAMDALLPLADTLGAALLRVAAEGVGLRATSLSGLQLGVLTDDNFMRARVRRVDAGPVQRALERAEVVVVPGGQAADKDGRPTMLGKNSSDLSAVLLAGALGLPACEIFSDVSGVYSGDPNLLSGVHLLERVAYQDLIDISRSGAKVLHHRAVATAQQHEVAIVCRYHRSPYQVGTVIGDGPPPRAVVVDARSLVLEFADASACALARAHLATSDVPTVTTAEDTRLVVTGGFFDAIAFLGARGVAATRLDLHLVSVFEPGEPPRRVLAAQRDAVATGQRWHARLLPTPPGAPAPAPSAAQERGDSLADAILPPGREPT
ncbi:Aspartate kinase [Haliangium ochraceum DSM 14365]|uniref:aspartate kinase n=1 Tax=Haliangium ochraceum (strain DSM 14365 / JCM 11303 / SMP-2) TaxID=502025 RepID=D0LME8_HALO1|nr:Aspartate kinase [Haliangium ochraceum DSM 14365]